MLFIAACAADLLAGDLKNIRMHEAPNSNRVVFDSDEPIMYKISRYDNPSRIVIDLKNTRPNVDLDVKSIAQTSKRLVSVRGARRGSDYRLVIETKNKIPFKAFILKPIASYGYRLVVDCFFNGESFSSKVGKSKEKKVPLDREEYRDINVVLDPGHGGEDPGAIGPNGIQEKKVVLDIARRIKNKLDNRLGFSAVLRRTGDYYVALQKRQEISRDEHVDAFISIHADAFRDPKVSGASVYFLSDEGEKSESTKWLEELEKQSDLIGGTGGDAVELYKGGPQIDRDQKDQIVIVNLVNEMNRAYSGKLGHNVLSEMAKVSGLRLHKRKVQEAGFKVLKGRQVPSILIEAGFISNPQEARRLNQLEHQERLSTAIANGIEKYFRQNSPAFTLLRHAGETKKYLVVRGDTLSEISARFGVSVRAIRRVNKLSNNTIRVGQSLIIPPVSR